MRLMLVKQLDLSNYSKLELSDQVVAIVASELHHVLDLLDFMVASLTIFNSTPNLLG